jgi:hypothetical protein
LPIPELQKAITGVAIGMVTDVLEVYFGCYSGSTGIGGIGVTRIDKHGLRRTLHAVEGGKQRVYGGTLFIADALIVDGCLASSIQTKIEQTTGRQEMASSDMASVCTPGTMSSGRCQEISSASTMPHLVNECKPFNGNILFFVGLLLQMMTSYLVSDMAVVFITTIYMCMELI